MAISSSATGLRPGVCTSTTRPTAPYTGQIIFETDTGYLRVWDGSAWDYLSKSQDGTTNLPISDIGTAWTAYTPTWSGTGGTPTLGNGVLSGRYAQIQKLAFLQMRLTWGSTTSATSITEWRFTFPTGLVPANIVNLSAIGSAAVLDSGTAVYRGVAIYQAGPDRILVYASDGVSTVGSTVPMTWAANDQLTVMCSYEVA